MQQPTAYNDDDIKTLDWMEHIRRRPGMYIGKLGDGSYADDGIYVLLKEVLDNSCLLYTSDAADDMQCVDLGGRRIIKKKIFSSRRRHTRSLSVSWARRCV